MLPTVALQLLTAGAMALPNGSASNTETGDAKISITASVTPTPTQRVVAVTFGDIRRRPIVPFGFPLSFQIPSALSVTRTSTSSSTTLIMGVETPLQELETWIHSIYEWSRGGEQGEFPKLSSGVPPSPTAAPHVVQETSAASDCIHRAIQHMSDGVPWSMEDFEACRGMIFEEIEGIDAVHIGKARRALEAQSRDCVDKYNQHERDGVPPPQMWKEFEACNGLDPELSKLLSAALSHLEAEGAIPTGRSRPRNCMEEARHHARNGRDPELSKTFNDAESHLEAEGAIPTRKARRALEVSSTPTSSSFEAKTARECMQKLLQQAKENGIRLSIADFHTCGFMI
ncbi:hypothetical protein EJ08DRAFT_724015 [Tothia fuscella]|uniref:Uncharacterized protein n=1 Tax=Tothia fuscella TaxID=1048955 RepID=A0A9P4U2E0_9PEZI|nr:hypothetical protein EJ08DRAFT_724015 [Tothia fuscella]